MEKKRDIKAMLPEEIARVLKEMGEPSFRGGQIFKWLHSGAVSFEEMTNLPKPLREKLKEAFYITAPVALKKQVSKLDGTVKYLWMER